MSKAALWSATDSMRTELAPRGVQVLGVYVGYVDTDMAAAVQAPKVASSDVVHQVLDSLEADEVEVLADETSRAVRAHLNRVGPRAVLRARNSATRIGALEGRARNGGSLARCGFR